MEEWLAAEEVPMTAERVREALVEMEQAQKSEDVELGRVRDEAESVFRLQRAEYYRLRKEGATEAEVRHAKAEMDRLSRLFQEAKRVRTAARKRFKEDARQLLVVKNPTQFRTRYRVGGKKRGGWDRGTADFRNMVPETKGMENWTVDFNQLPGGQRAYESQGDIYVPSKGGSVVVHELGHVLETRNARVKARARYFLRERTRGERAEWLGDSYDKDEITKRDKFLNAYMGKQYPMGQATEIMSMGLEYMHKDPMSFARRDPEYFDFIYDTVRGQ